MRFDISGDGEHKEDGTHELLMAFFGSVPVNVVVDVISVYEKKYPGCVAIDADHLLSKKLGATLCIAKKVC